MCELPSQVRRLARIVRSVIDPFCGAGTIMAKACDDGSMATIARFNIGEAFPADDPAARFVTVLAMVSNDHIRAVRLLGETDGDSDEDRARRTWVFRWLTATHYEAIDFIVKTRSWYPSEVTRLLAGAPDAQETLTAVLAAVDPRSEKYLGAWLEDHRNVMFHYAKLQPDAARHGAEEMHEALRRAADIDGTIINGDVLAQNLFPFADEVVVQWMPKDPEVLTKLVAASLDLVTFTQLAMREYVKTLPRGVLTIERG